MVHMYIVGHRDICRRLINMFHGIFMECKVHNEQFTWVAGPWQVDGEENLPSRDRVY